MADEVRDSEGLYASRNEGLRDFNAILQRDSKDTTYKFALLRALTEIAEQDEHLLEVHDAQTVRLPLGMVVDRWLRYYYPLVEQNLPQRHGRGSLSFGTAFGKLTAYYASRGGLGGFWRDYAAPGRLPDDVMGDFLDLVKKLRRTIIDMPMKHLGYSLTHRHYGIVRPLPGQRPNFRAIADQGGDRAAVIAGLGACLLRRDFHDTLRALGGFATGTQALLMEWARFTARASGRSISVSGALDTLLVDAEIDRDVALVKKVWLGRLADSVPVSCVWSGRTVGSSERLAIDHAIPFSLWGNNDLWNLLPTLDRINAQKSDAIPAPELVIERREWIVDAWRATRTAHGATFDRDVALSLGAHPGPAWETEGIAALVRKCRYLIEERGYAAWRPR